MNRDEKAAVVEKVAADIEASDAIFAIDYRGISVTQAADLRTRLRDTDSSFTVVKNRLTKLAAAKAGVTALDDVLTGPTALTFVRGDVAAAAKAITTFNKDANVLTFKGGYMGETLLNEERFTAISKLPSRDVLNAQLAGVVASPIVGLTRGLGSMISGIARQLQMIADQGLVSGAAPEAPAEEALAAEEAPAEEPAAEEAPAEEAAAEAPAEEAAAEAPAEEAAAEEPAAEETPAEEVAAEEAPAEEASADEAETPAEEAEAPAAEEAAAEEAPADEAEAPAEEGADE